MISQYWSPLVEEIEEARKRIANREAEATKEWRFLLAMTAEPLAYYTLSAIIELRRWTEVESDVDTGDEEDRGAGWRR